MDLATLFRTVRDIPYRIPLTSTQADYSCNGKTSLLKMVLEYKRVDVRPRFCEFRWSDMEHLPDDVRDVHHEEECGHVYLEVKIGSRWYVVDPTWDQRVHRVLPVNEWTGETKNMKIAVPPRRIYSPKDSLDVFLEEDTKPEEDPDVPFYAAFNEWLEEVRRTYNFRLKQRSL